MTNFKINLCFFTGTAVEWKKHINQKVRLWANMSVFVQIFWRRSRKLEALHNTDKAFCTQNKWKILKMKRLAHSQCSALCGYPPKPHNIWFQQRAFMAIECRQQQSLPFGLHVKCSLFYPILTLDITDILIGAHSIRVHRNSSSGRHAETFRQTDMTKLIGAFGDYANARKITANINFVLDIKLSVL